MSSPQTRCVSPCCCRLTTAGLVEVLIDRKADTEMMLSAKVPLPCVATQPLYDLSGAFRQQTPDCHFVKRSTLTDPMDARLID